MDRLEAMSVLLSVVEAGSISAASRKLRVPLATVSRKISDLEAHLKVQLLMRSNRQVVLTDAGRSFVAACRRILQDVDDAEREAADEVKVPRGELTVSAPIALGRLYLLPVVVEFLRDYPGIDVRMQLTDRRLNLIDDHIDVALRVGELLDDSLIAKKVGTVRRVVCASTSYLERRGTPMSPDDLKDHDCLTFENTLSAQAWDFMIGGMRKSFPIHSRLVVSTAETAVEAAVAGVGLTRMLDYQIDKQRREDALRVVLEDFGTPAKPVHLIYEQAVYLPLKTRTFLDHAAPRLKEAFRALRTSFVSFAKTGGSVAVQPVADPERYGPYRVKSTHPGGPAARFVVRPKAEELLSDLRLRLRAVPAHAAQQALSTAPMSVVARARPLSLAPV
jgi:DNA-binding transcriptional LysR family regulator